MTKLHRDEADGGSGSWTGAEPGLAGKRTMTQRLARRRDGNGVADGAEAAVERAATGTGDPLRADVRDRFESSLGADLSAVRVHRSAASADANAAVGAKAYTVGNDIHFNAGQYQPDDPFGMHLLAHEVAHTQQQAGGPQRRQHQLEVSAPGDAAELEADRAADAMVTGAPVGGGLGGARFAIHRFGTDEHTEMGDSVKDGAATQQVELAPGYQISYGEQVAMAGDFFRDLDQMRAMAAKPGPGAGTREEIEYVRAVKVRHGSASSFSAEAIAAADARYYKLAANNASHFVNPMDDDADKSPTEKMAAPDRKSMPANAIAGYRRYHERAIAEAIAAGQAKQPIESSLAAEAFGGHYLTDSFAGGHVRTQRRSIQTYWNDKVPMFFINLKGFMAEEIARRLKVSVPVGPFETQVDVPPALIYDRPKDDNPKQGALATVSEKLDAKGDIGFGDMVAGAVHDYDNQHGVDATSQGNPVELYGDGKAGTGDEQRLAEEALECGIADVRTAWDLGKVNGDPIAAATAAGSLVGADGLYDAERIVPVALPDDEQGPDRQQVMWWQDDVEALLNDAQFQEAAVLFANEKVATLTEIASTMGAEEKAAIDDGVIAPLKSDPIGTLRTIINWTPKLAAEAGTMDATKASLKGVTKESRAHDYWKATRGEGAKDALTYTQRHRLIRDLLDGSNQAEADVLSILRSASDADTRALIKSFGWTVLFDAIDDGLGDGDKFATTYPEAEYK